MNAKPTLIYFPVRGRAELIRLVLAETGLDYAEHPVTAKTPPQNGRPTDFAELKASEHLPFGAVPVWEEPDGFRLAQSLAIVRYLARPHGLLGANARDEARVDQLLGAHDDVRPELRRLYTAPPEARASTRTELGEAFLPRWLGYFDRVLAANGTEGHVVGASLTAADLALFNVLELIRDLGFTSVLGRHPRLVSFLESLAQRPRLKAYLTGPRRHAFVPPPA